MARFWVLIAGLALVGTACGGGGSTNAVRTPSRASSTTSTVATSTTTTTATSTTTTTTPPPPTTNAPQAATSAAPAPAPEPAAAAASPPGNGQFPDSSLTTVTASCRMPNELAPRLQNLLAAAHADGIALWPETKPYTNGPTPPRLTSCYRDFEMQQWWRDYYCGIGQCGMAAVPGTSRHGWGRAVDFEQGGEELEFHMAGYQWLVARAGEFGFFQPSWAGPGGGSPEPWHWEAS